MDDGRIDRDRILADNMQCADANGVQHAPSLSVIWRKWCDKRSWQAFLKSQEPKSVGAPRITRHGKHSARARGLAKVSVG